MIIYVFYCATTTADQRYTVLHSCNENDIVLYVKTNFQKIKENIGTRDPSLSTVQITLSYVGGKQKTPAVKYAGITSK